MCNLFLSQHNRICRRNFLSIFFLLAIWLFATLPATAAEECTPPCPSTVHTHPSSEGKLKGKIAGSGDKGSIVNPPVTSSGTAARGGGGGPIVANPPKTVDINTDSEQALAAIPSIGPQTARAIIAQRSKGVFKSSADFAARLCGQHSVDFGFETNVKIQHEMHAPRGSDPKSPAFKCAVGQSTFEIAGKKHNYVGHVTLLR